MPGRIGATISSTELRLLNRLAQSNAAVTLHNLRLATGKKIGDPRDNPTGYIAMAQFESRRNRVTRTLSNVSQASSLVSQANLTLDQIRTQLNTIRTNAKADEDQALTAAQRTANQAAIDAAIVEINRLANSEIGGRRLLDGSADFWIEGVNSGQVSDARVVSLGPNSSQTISGSVTAAGQQAQLTHVEVTGLITAAATVTLTGDRGSADIAVAIGESLATVATRINQESHLTGIAASVSGGTNLVLASINYGTAARVQVALKSGAFTSGSATGGNATATINGRAVTGDGNRFEIVDNGFHASVEFQPGFTGAFSTITASGSALTFAVTPDAARRATLAIPGLQSARLGGLSGTLDQIKTGGSLGGLSTNAPLAVRVVDEALADLTRIDGLVDGFTAAALTASTNLLDAMEADLGDAIDQIDKVDDDEELAMLDVNQALANNAIAGLAILSNQRAGIVELIRRLAGLD